jgi:butanol dehydrogenase
MVEHPLSALYELTYGVGLAILAPHWMEYVLDETTVEKLGNFARNVWGHTQTDPYALACAGIDSTREFYRQLVLPVYLSEVGVDDSRFDEIIAKALRGGMQGHFKVLAPQELYNIPRKAWSPQSNG